MLSGWIQKVQKCTSESFSISVLFSQKTHKCKSFSSRQELSNKYLVFTCKIWRRYSRERASQSLPKISQRLEKKIEKNIARGPAAPHERARGREAPRDDGRRRAELRAHRGLELPGELHDGDRVVRAREQPDLGQAAPTFCDRLWVTRGSERENCVLFSICASEFL